MAGIDGKVIAITGASSGIGRAAALLLAGRGATVVLGARRIDELEAVVREIERAGGVASHRRTDVAKREDVAALTALASDRHGKLDVLINNAGIGPISKLDQLRIEDWEAMVDINVKGLLYGIAADASHFLSARFWSLRQHDLDRWHPDQPDDGGLCRHQECRAHPE